MCQSKLQFFYGSNVLDAVFEIPKIIPCHAAALLDMFWLLAVKGRLVFLWKFKVDSSPAVWLEERAAAAIDASKSHWSPHYMALESYHRQILKWRDFNFAGGMILTMLLPELKCVDKLESYMASSLSYSLGSFLAISFHQTVWWETTNPPIHMFPSQSHYQSTRGTKTWNFPDSSFFTRNFFLDEGCGYISRDISKKPKSTLRHINSA